MILSVQNVSKSFGEDVILEGINFQVNEYEKVAIVGSNGAGKSTLLRIIVGESQPDEGMSVISKDASFGYLAQYQDLNIRGSIYEIVLHAREDILSLEKELRSMESRMTELSGPDLEKLLEDYHQASERFLRMGGEAYYSEVTGVLKGLGFSEDEFSKTANELSGGQLTRVFLAKLLVTKPDLLILDEPINHLDLTSIQWLEGFLSNYKGAVLIVAHDRYFLDKICDHVLDLTMGVGEYYKGNFTAYTQQKSQRMLTRMREYQAQQKEIAHQQQVIDRLKSFNREKSIKRAESRQKVLDKMVRVAKPIEEDTAMKLSLAPLKTSGNDVLIIDDLKKSYDGVTLFEGVHLEIHRGEKVAVLGDNGTGKSTLLKIINDRIPADRGTVKIGSNVSIAYYDQAQQELTDRNTLFEEMSDAYPDLTETKIRNVLAAFLFTGDDCFKLISELSGGERGRVSLAKLMLSGANFLILDEPTNHLDMESKEILERALNAFEGTLLYVSHDRYFVNQTAQRILELENCGFHEYLGNYDYFVEKKAQLTEEKQADAAFARDNLSESKLDFKEQKRLAAEKRKKENALASVEAAIADLEERLLILNSKFNDPSIASNSAKLNEVSLQAEELQKQLDQKMEEWESLLED